MKKELYHCDKCKEDFSEEFAARSAKHAKSGGGMILSYDDRGNAIYSSALEVRVEEKLVLSEKETAILSVYFSQGLGAASKKFKTSEGHIYRPADICEKCFKAVIAEWLAKPIKAPVKEPEAEKPLDLPTPRPRRGRNRPIVVHEGNGGEVGAFEQAVDAQLVAPHRLLDAEF